MTEGFTNFFSLVSLWPIDHRLTIRLTTGLTLLLNFFCLFGRFILFKKNFKFMKITKKIINLRFRFVRSEFKLGKNSNIQFGSNFHIFVFCCCLKSFQILKLNPVHVDDV